MSNTKPLYLALNLVKVISITLLGLVIFLLELHSAEFFVVLSLMVRTSSKIC